MTTATPLCKSRNSTFRSGVALGLLLAAVIAAPAHAEAYLGAGVGIANQQLICVAGAPCDDNAMSLRLMGGYQFNRQFGTELGWLRVTPKFTASDSVPGLNWSGSFDVEVLSAAATWTIPVRSVGLQLRAGIASVRGRFTSASVGVADSSRSDVRALIGASLRRAFTDSWNVRVDLDVTDAQVYTKNGRFSVLSVGIERRF